MASPTSWEFYKEVETKILWVNICTQNLEGIAILEALLTFKFETFANAEFICSLIY